MWKNYFRIRFKFLTFTVDQISKNSMLGYFVKSVNILKMISKRFKGHAV
jgi:hypothetical protein